MRSLSDAEAYLPSSSILSIPSWLVSILPETTSNMNGRLLGQLAIPPIAEFRHWVNESIYHFQMRDFNFRWRYGGLQPKMLDKSSWRIWTTRLTNVGLVRSSLAYPPEVGIPLTWEALPTIWKRIRMRERKAKNEGRKYRCRMYVITCIIIDFTRCPHPCTIDGRRHVNISLDLSASMQGVTNWLNWYSTLKVKLTLTDYKQCW